MEEVMEEQVVFIVIEKGLVDVMDKSKGIRLVIRDFDTDGCTPEKDDGLLGNEEDGYYFETIHEADENI
jgi:hypothetical protein